MAGEPTLGDILGAAISAANAALLDEPLVDRGRYVAGLTLADQLAPRFAVSAEEVFDALCTVPDEMLSLLDTPEGWGVLSGYIATDFGLPVITYRPTIH